MLEECKRPLPGAEWEPEQSRHRPMRTPPPLSRPAGLAVPITPWAVNFAFMVVAEVMGGGEGGVQEPGCCLCLCCYVQTHLVLAYVLMSEVWGVCVGVCVCVCVCISVCP